MADSAVRAGLGATEPIPVDGRFPIVAPTGYRLRDKTPTEPAALIFQAGRIQIGLAISDARSLGQALLALGAEKGPYN